MIAKVNSAAFLGIQAYPVEIEVDIANGLPQFNVVGLPDTSVKESKERVRSAIKNSGFAFPAEKITVNLAPADIKKEGPAFDLPIALGILAASGMIPQETLNAYTFLGELALDGSLRSFKGSIVIANTLKKKTAFVFPFFSAAEAQLEKEAVIYPVQNLKEAVAFLREELRIAPAPPADIFPFQENSYPVDFSEVRGQAAAKRAIEIAVAGGHNLLLIGPPGAGKSMLAGRITSILPPLNFGEALQITKIYSVAGNTQAHSLVRHRPFRSPHYSISSAALIGGGSWPKPGEISLAHDGVLFLDELPEFRKDVLEALRIPLEDGEILISRSKMQARYPCRFTLVAAMNPCPCGYLSDPKKACRCSLEQIRRYQNRISGPIFDRIDLHVEVPRVSYSALTEETREESSGSIRQRIMACREIQGKRFKQLPYRLNAHMRPREIKTFAPLSKEAQALFEKAMKELHLSARAYYKILKISRTIADLDTSGEIKSEHIAEAIQYRSLDRP